MLKVLELIIFVQNCELFLGHDQTAGDAGGSTSRQLPRPRPRAERPGWLVFIAKAHKNIHKQNREMDLGQKNFKA